MYKILHIMPHMGPGVGKAVSALSITAVRDKSKYQHRILLLEQPRNLNYVTLCNKNGIDVFWTQDQQRRANIIADADIVQLEWWHHPLVLGFLRDLASIPIRLTVWSHISGCNYPVIPAEFIDLSEQFIFTTAYSYENPFWNDAERQHIRSKTSVAVGSGGYDNVVGLDPKSHKNFNIGFVGTLDFRKLHPEFVDFCARVDIPSAKFILAGNPDNKTKILAQAHERSIEDRFEFTGFVDNIKAEFERFDIFGYLLNPDHYGSTDNALLEAMGAAMPIVILDQCGEKHVVKDMETGLIVKNKEDYGRAVRYLYDNPKERVRLGQNAKNAAFNEFSPLTTMKNLDSRYELVMSMAKKDHDFSRVFGLEPCDWFLSGLGKERALFEASISDTGGVNNNIGHELLKTRNILREKTKSSIPHFYRYYPHDEILAAWCQKISDDSENVSCP